MVSFIIYRNTLVRFLGFPGLSHSSFLQFDIGCQDTMWTQNHFDRQSLLINYLGRRKRERKKLWGAESHTRSFVFVICHDHVIMWPNKMKTLVLSRLK